MACQCGCSTDAPTPDSEERPVAEERDLERVIEELENRVKQLEAERAAA